MLVFGDSLSAGFGIDVDQSWPALLQSRLALEGYEHRVVNASISGETTEGGATRISTALESFEPELVILELGGNDGLRGIPLDVTRRNLAAILEAVRASGARSLLLGMRLPPNYGPAYTGSFHAMYEELAAQHGVARVPFLLDGVGGVNGMMQADGIHPVADAQPLMLDNVWPHLEPLL